VWTFENQRIRGVVNGKDVVCKFSLDATKSPPHIDWALENPPANEEKFVAKGIYRFQGGSLQICARIGLDKEPPKRPTGFATDKQDDSLILLLFTQAEQ